MSYNAKTQVFNTIVELKSLKGSSDTIVKVLGYTENNDGGGGEFYWDSASVATDNGGTIFQVTGVTTGRWIRKLHEKIFSVKWFGAKGDDVTNDRSPSLAAIAAAGTGGIVYFPKGDYYITGAASGDGELLPLPGQTLFGDGESSQLRTSTNTRIITFYNGSGGNNNITIHSLKFKGSGKNDGKNFQSGVAAIFGNYWNIYNCYFDSLSGTPAQSGGGGIVAGIIATTNSPGSRIGYNRYTNCNGGLCLLQRAEYVSVDGGKADNCNTGLVLGAGNCSISNFICEENTIGVDVIAGTNDSHNTVVGCTFNHNITNIKVKDTVYGMLFTGCNIWLGSITIDNAIDIKFSNCIFIGGGLASSHSFNIINKSNVSLSDCRLPRSPLTDCFIENIEATSRLIFTPTEIAGKVSPLSSVVTDPDLYDAFPWPIVWKNPVTNIEEILVYTKKSSTHADSGPMTLYRSLDGGKSWDSGVQVNVGGNISCVSLGASNIRGRIIITYNDTGSYDITKFAYSDDGGITYTSAGSFNFRATYSSATFNKIVELPSGKLYQPYYEIGGSDSRAAFIQSTNNGVSWSQGPIVLDQAGGSFPNGQTSEIGVCITHNTGVDSTVKMIALLRNEDYASYTHVKSSDGGTTWVEDTTNLFDEFGSQVFRCPVQIENFNGLIYFVCGNRRVGGYAVEVVTSSPDDAYNNTSSGYSTINRLYQSSAFFKAAAEDFGYNEQIVYNNELFTFFYDVSPINHNSTEGDDDCRVVMIKISGNHYGHAYNNATQSIPNAGAITQIITPDLYLDGDSSFNLDGVTDAHQGYWECKEDGFYLFHAYHTYTGNSTGTYRESWIEIRDPAQNTINNAGNRILGKTAIVPNSNYIFQKIAISALEYVRKGEQARIFTRHDGTTSIDLKNDTQEDMTFFKITKIQ